MKVAEILGPWALGLGKIESRGFPNVNNQMFITSRDCCLSSIMCAGLCQQFHSLSVFFALIFHLLQTSTSTSTNSVFLLLAVATEEKSTNTTPINRGQRDTFVPYSIP
jgi:hypothetical protein